MFYVKGDDMDDMFREAAEDYELNEDLAADWNSVHSVLLHDDSLLLRIHQPEEKKQTLLLVIVVAVNFGGIIYNV